MPTIKQIKRQLAVAAISVVFSAIALTSATYAWFVTNSGVNATTSTISAQANGMVLQIVAGDIPDHGSDSSTVASGAGHEISPSSTNDANQWYVPATWKIADVSTYQVASVDATGKYSLQGNDYYAYVAEDFTLYTVNNTGQADVYLDGSNGSPITITKPEQASEDWFNKIKGTLRVGIVINDKLRVVYAPVEPNGHGNDVNFTEGWSCVNPSDSSQTMKPTYEALSGIDLTNASGNWGATKDGDSYVKPSGNNPQKIAENVDYNGVHMKVVIWMEGTDADCQNMSGLETGVENPTFDVTVSLVGIVPDSTN